MERNTRIKSRTEQEVEVRTGRDLVEQLRELYVDLRWTDQEIADHLGVSRVTVTNWRGTFGIARSERRAVLPESAA